MIPLFYPVALRKALLWPLDDLLAVVREVLNQNNSRSRLDRSLLRHTREIRGLCSPKSIGPCTAP